MEPRCRPRARPGEEGTADGELQRQHIEELLGRAAETKERLDQLHDDLSRLEEEEQPGLQDD